MQVVYVAGGAGFIGSHLCRELLKQEHQVVCIDNFLTSSKKNIQEFLDNPSFQFVQADVIEALPENLPNPDFIFHLASPASPNIKSPRSYMAFPLQTLLVNSHGTYNLLELAKKSHARFLYASTSEIYGDPHVSPQPEDYFGNVSPNGPRSVYDEAKRFGEAITMHYYRKDGLDTRIVRIFNTYGPYMQIDDGRVVSNFIVQAIQNKPLTVYGKGEQTRSFCYISDMIDGLKLLMFKDSIKGEVVNLGNPNEKKISDFATIVQETMQSRSQIIFEDLPEDDPKKRKPDITKAMQLLNWEPKVGLEEGLRKTIEYFNSL